MAEDEEIADRVIAAGEALDALEGPAREAADAVGAAFRAAGAEIEDALAKAARSGELSFQAMAVSVGRELSALALDRFVRAPVGGALDGLLGAGASVVSGAAGLSPVTINMNVPASTPDLHRSGAQIAAAAGRAAARALRRL